MNTINPNTPSSSQPETSVSSHLSSPLEFPSPPHSISQVDALRQRELFRHAILLQLEAAFPAALPIETLYRGLLLAGHPQPLSTLAQELAYLQDKSFLIRHTPPLSPAHLRYRLTSYGRDYLESQGLA